METFDRDKAIEKAEHDDKVQNYRQCCTKIRTGLDNLDANSGERAIWELVQNACDLSDDTIIRIVLNNDDLLFEHQGKPFTYETFTSLIKQVTSADKVNETKKGRYGTGFMTTHKFSRIIYITSSLDLGDGHYTDITDFPLDRRFDNIDPEFIDKMGDQLEDAMKLVENGEIREKKLWTTFRYPLTDETRTIATKAVDEAIKLMPFVMLLNNISKCIISKDYKTFEFSKRSKEDEGGLHVVSISTGNDEIDLYYLSTEDKENIAIMPLNSSQNAIDFSVYPKLFLWFPLLGTEDWGVNFIFNSSNFAPVEERNGIILPKGNDNVKDKYERDEKIISTLSDLVLSYLKNNIKEIDNTILLARINFPIDKQKDDLTKQFYEKQQAKWADIYQTLPMIPTIKGKLALKGEPGVYIFDKTLIDIFKNENIKEKYYDSVYELASLHYTLPTKDECPEWSEIVNQWGCDLTGHTLNVEMIASTIVDNSDELLLFDKFLKETNNDSLFDKYSLIPNRTGVLGKRNDRKDGSTVKATLYDRLKPIIKEKIDKLVDEKFKNITKLEEYTRKNVQIDLKEKISSVEEETLNNISSRKPYPSDFANALRAYCALFYSNSKLENNNWYVILSKIYKLHNQTLTIERIDKVNEDEPDIFGNALRHLLLNEMMEISLFDDTKVIAEWNNIKELLIAVDSVKEEKFRERYFDNFAVFPNANKKLCTGKDIKDCDSREPDLIKIYKDATGKDLNDELVHSDFIGIYADKIEKVNSKQLAREITDSLKEVSYNKSCTLVILSKFDKGEWSELFEEMYTRRAEIYMEYVPKDAKPSIYRLMKVKNPDALKDLADIADNADLFEKVKNFVQGQKEKQVDFNVKYKFGKRVEDILRKEIASDMADNLSFNTMVEDSQAGQDIVISFNGKEIFYIECKAKWSFNEPAHMSANQMKKATRFSDCYAVCCVNLKEYSLEQDVSPEDIIQNTYVHLNIGNELQSIMDGINKTDSLSEISEENQENTIIMDNSFRCNIPEKVFNKGERDSLKSLIVKIKQRILDI